MADDSAISHVLLHSLRERLRARPVRSAIELAVCAAIEPEVEQRAWGLVALAHRLRRERATELARLALDGAIALDAGPAVTRAARTVSVSLLADDGHLGAAAALGEQLLAEAHDPGVLKALASVYWQLWQETKDEAWHDRWWQVNVLRQDLRSPDEDDSSLAPTGPAAS
jgi:hypothetical protein